MWCNLTDGDVPLSALRQELVLALVLLGKHSTTVVYCWLGNFTTGCMALDGIE
jgi:hypothetical protein